MNKITIIRKKDKGNIFDYLIFKNFFLNYNL